MALSKDEKRLRILEIIADYKTELALSFNKNHNDSAKENKIWEKIMDKALNQGLYCGPGVDVVTFKTTTWCRWRGDTYAKYKRAEANRNCKFSPYQKFIIVNICGEALPVRKPDASKNGRGTKRVFASEGQAAHNSNAMDESSIDNGFQRCATDTRNEEQSGNDLAESVGSDAPFARTLNDAPCGTNTSNRVQVLASRVENLEALVLRLQQQAALQQQQLQQQQQSLLKQQQQLQMQAQQLQIQPQQSQMQQHQPHQWWASQNGQADSLNTVYVMDIPNKVD